MVVKLGSGPGRLWSAVEYLVVVLLDVVLLIMLLVQEAAKIVLLLDAENAIQTNRQTEKDGGFDSIN